MNNIYLIGPMGAGKTTIGKTLAKALRKRFFDCDAELEQRTGVSISTIFDIEGEAGFRKREAKMLAELAGHDDTVLATGGGAILSAANRELLAARGYIIYLRADQEDLWLRMSRQKNRPLLDTEAPKARLLEIVQARIPIYEQLADLTITTGRGSVRRVVGDICDKLNAL